MKRLDLAKTAEESLKLTKGKMQSTESGQLTKTTKDIEQVDKLISEFESSEAGQDVLQLEAEVDGPPIGAGSPVLPPVASQPQLATPAPVMQRAMAELGALAGDGPGTPPNVGEVTAQLTEALTRDGYRRRSQAEADALAIAEELLFVS